MQEQERYADPLDEATALASALTEGAIAAASRAVERETHPDFDGKHCVEDDCGAEIPKERLKMGRVRCVSCQSRLEQKSRQHAKVGWTSAWPATQET